MVLVVEAPAGRDLSTPASVSFSASSVFCLSSLPLFFNYIN